MAKSKKRRSKPPRKRKNKPMTLEPHPHIKAVRPDVDEDSNPVTVVVTDLVMNANSPRYDKVAFDNLRQHVEAWQREGVRRVTIEGPWE